MIGGLEREGPETGDVPRKITMVLELPEELARRCFAATGVREVEGKVFDKVISVVIGVQIEIIAKPGELYDCGREGPNRYRPVSPGSRALQFVGTDRGISDVIAIARAEQPQSQRKRTFFPRRI